MKKEAFEALDNIYKKDEERKRKEKQLQELQSVKERADGLAAVYCAQLANQLNVSNEELLNIVKSGINARIAAKENALYGTEMQLEELLKVK